MGAPWAMGSRYWKVFGSAGPDCIVETGGELEMGELPPRFYRVPRDIGRLTFQVGRAGVDFSPLAPYAVPKSSNVVRRARERSDFH
jgi:hypothetical protein